MTNSSAGMPMLLHHLLIASRQQLKDTLQPPSAPLHRDQRPAIRFLARGDLWSERWPNVRVVKCPTCNTYINNWPTKEQTMRTCHFFNVSWLKMIAV